MPRAPTTSDAFNAIAEPQRRQILSLLIQREHPVNDVARALRISQPRASKHLHVLHRVGLVRVRRAGKERIYGLEARGLKPVHEWIGGFEQFWNESFDRLNQYVVELQERSARMAEVDSSAAAEREIAQSRTIDAPRSIVFEAYTRVEHLNQWFGPKGFSAHTSAFEFRQGGVWEFIMRGPGGVEYPNWVQWVEIIPPERIVYLHGAHADDPRVFVATLTLVERDGATDLTLHALFRTRQQRDEVIERFGALERGKETLERLAVYARQLKEGSQ